MDHAAALFLMSPEGHRVIEELGGDVADTLRAGTRLRKLFPHLPPAFLAATVDLVRARNAAATKFPGMPNLFATSEAVEQATHHTIATHRAARFAGLGRVMDACAGIGGDALALGAVVRELTCVEADPGRMVFLQANCAARGIDAVFFGGDIREMLARLTEFDAVFIDPARRQGGKRTSGLDTMEPPFEIVRDILTRVPGGAVKLSPALKELPVIGIPAEYEWISFAGGLKELVLWTGNLAHSSVSVTLADRGITLRDTDLLAAEAPIAAPGAWLYEPDPALIRSGLVARVAASVGMTRIDPAIAYLSADHPIDSPLFHGYRVLTWFPFDLERLRRELAAMGAGVITVKKRGFPLEPEEVIRKLRLTGRASATVVLTRRGKEHLAFIVEPSGDRACDSVELSGQEDECGQ